MNKENKGGIYAIPVIDCTHSRSSSPGYCGFPDFDTCLADLAACFRKGARCVIVFVIADAHTSEKISCTVRYDSGILSLRM